MVDVFLECSKQWGAMEERKSYRGARVCTHSRPTFVLTPTAGKDDSEVKKPLIACAAKLPENL